MDALDQFRKVWLVDFEFHQPPGSLPTPLCMVAMELRSGQLLRLWLEERTASPFSFGEKDLFVAYLATAELKCFLRLGWALPPFVLDLFVEFKRFTSGRYSPSGHGLLGALAYFGLPGLEKLEKEAMRDLAIRGAPFMESEKRALIDYCQTDVEALHSLITRMAAKIDLPRALIRGEYMKALARIELRGVPIDITRLATLTKRWIGSNRK